VTTNTPPVSSTANELPIASPVRRVPSTRPLLGSITPTIPCSRVTNQTRPRQSGRAELSWSSAGITAFRV